MNVAKIEYREFYDVPRVFLVRYRQQYFLFESSFDEQYDDYAPIYDVYLMPDLTREEMTGSWGEINKKAIRKIGEIPVDQIKFDTTFRKEINTDKLEELLFLDL